MMIIFTQFHKDYRKNMEFLLIAKFWDRELFSYHPLSTSSMGIFIVLRAMGILVDISTYL